MKYYSSSFKIDLLFFLLAYNAGSAVDSKKTVSNLKLCTVHLVESTCNCVGFCYIQASSDYFSIILTGKTYLNIDNLYCILIISDVLIKSECIDRIFHILVFEKSSW